MNIEHEFPFRVYINLYGSPDRRSQMESQLAAAKMTAKRIDSVNGDYLQDTRGFKGTHTRAMAINTRSILHEATRKNYDATLILSDNVVFSDGFSEKAEELCLPRDWGMFYFGCIHVDQARWHSEGIVRVGRCVDAHAIAIRRPYYADVINVLSDGPQNSAGEREEDVDIMHLHDRIPTYAAWPNLIWPGVGDYNPDGSQKVLTRFLPSRISKM